MKVGSGGPDNEGDTNPLLSKSRPRQATQPPFSSLEASFIDGPRGWTFFSCASGGGALSPLVIIGRSDTQKWPHLRGM